jgi:hypothetical protein
MNNEPDPLPPPSESSRERALSSHLFGVSAGLVGVCLTVVGILNFSRRHGDPEGRIADNLVSIDAIVFLFACIFAYLALRASDEQRWRQLERYADVLFLVGISAMVLIAALIAFDRV